MAVAALASPGCGGSHASTAAASGPCSATARAVIAGDLATRVGRVTAEAFVLPSGAAGCRFLARRPAASPVGVLAAIDTAPQAYARFDRATVEYSQNVLWSHQGAPSYPQDIAGLGLGADWFPAERRLMTTDGTRIVDITVTWSGAAAAPARRLAEILARRYLAAR